MISSDLFIYTRLLQKRNYCYQAKSRHKYVEHKIKKEDGKEMNTSIHEKRTKTNRCGLTKWE